MYQGLAPRSDSVDSFGGFLYFQPKEARGVDKTTGKADINYVSDDGDDYEDDEDWEERFSKPADDIDGRKTSLGQRKGIEVNEDDDDEEEQAQETTPRPVSPVPAPEMKEEKIKFNSRRDSVSSASSTSSASSSSSTSSRGGGSSDDYSDSKADDKTSKKAEEHIVILKQGQQESEDEGKAYEIPVGHGEGDVVHGGDEKPVETEVEKDEVVAEAQTETKTIDISRASSFSISSSISSESAAIHDQDPNIINNPTIVLNDIPEKKEDKEEILIKEEEKKEDVHLALFAAPTSFQEVVDPPKQCTEDISRASSSTISSSSSSGSAAIHDQGPNIINDPTIVINDTPEKKEEKEEILIKEEEKKEDVHLALFAAPTTVQEIVDPPKQFTEGTQRDQKKDSDSSSSEDSDSESSLDSDSDNNSKEQNKYESNAKKDTTIETTADVHHNEEGNKHRLSYGTFQEAESDPEATHGGNDPDNVANESDFMTVKRTIDPVPLGHPKEGSVAPLLEVSKKEVEIKAVTLNKTQVYEVAEHLEKSDQLVSVTLMNCGIDDDDVQKLMEAVRYSSSNPKILNLSLNPLTSASVSHIMRTVRIKPSIEAVLLQGTRLGDDGVIALVDEVIAHYNSVKDNPDEKDNGLHELDLSDSKFGDEGTVAISRLLKSEVDIDTLTLSYNHAISLEGWKIFGNSLSKTNNLETLTLDHNFIGDEGIEAIASGLHHNMSVTALDINDVGITDTGARSIMDMLKKNTTMLEIVMMDNKTSDSIVENIQKYITLNKAAYDKQADD